MTDRAVVNVEACGETISSKVLECVARGARFRYVFDGETKAGESFSFGAFFSKAVLSDEVFRYPRSQRIGVITESPIDRCYQHVPELIRRFPLIYTHQRELLAMGPQFLPLMFGTNWLGIRDGAATDRILMEHPQKDAMVSFIGSLEHADVGAYRFRRAIAEYAVGRGDVECFGRGIRPIEGKRVALERFRFSIAMENASSDDYFSEKLVDCLLLETVPIYFGWPSFAEHLDPRGIITFRSVEELGAILDRLTPQLYEEMRPFVIANKEVVVARRWHNHQGLLERLSEQLPQPLVDSNPVRFRAHSRAERAARRLYHRLVS
jgi:hypothetical protein